jgi:hypothetical protein
VVAIVARFVDAKDLKAGVDGVVHIIGNAM